MTDRDEWRDASQEVTEALLEWSLDWAGLTSLAEDHSEKVLKNHIGELEGLLRECIHIANSIP